MSDSNKLGVLLFSTIRHIDGYLPFLTGRPRLEIRAVTEESSTPKRLRERTEGLADRHGFSYVDDPERALANPNIDVVVIGSENTRHARLALAAVRAGKHVIVDKPMSTTLEEADELIDAATHAGVKATYVRRLFSPAIERARESVSSGEIGLPRTLQITWLSTGALDPSKLDIQLLVDLTLSGGGELLNFLPYALDYLRWITGLEVESVYAATSSLFQPAQRDHGNEDFALISVNLQHGVIATIAVGRAATLNHPGLGTYRLRMLGSYGAIQVEEERPRLDVLSNELGQINRFADGGATPAMFSGFFDDFVQAVDQDRAPRRTPVDWRIALQIVEAAYQSARAGQLVGIHAGRMVL